MGASVLFGLMRLRKEEPFRARCTRSLQRLARATTPGFTSGVLVRRKQVPTLGACQKELLSSAEVKAPSVLQLLGCVLVSPVIPASISSDLRSFGIPRPGHGH